MLDRRSVAVMNAARADLLDRVGADRVLVGVPAREAIGGGEGDEPIAVVRPVDARDVSTVLRVGRARHLTVAPRARLPVHDPASMRGAIVLDCSGLDRPPAIDISRRVVTVGVAVPVEVIDRAARRARLALRGTSAFDAVQPIGALLASGAPLEVGLGAGELAADVVSAVVVAGSGRILTMGPAELVGQAPWGLAGLPHPGALMHGADGRLGVLVEVSLRLWPAPFAAWAELTLPAGRDGVLAALSAGRRAIGARLIDTLLLEDDGAGGVSGRLRLCSLRDADDLDGVAARVAEICGRLGIVPGPAQREPPRMRLGQDALQPPWAEASGDALDLRVGWPDAPKVQDVVDALASTGAQPTRRLWALGLDGARLRLLPALADDHERLLAGAEHLLDAGAVPVSPSGALRDRVRERMPSTAKVLLTALSRVWDPDDVLAVGRGPF